MNTLYKGDNDENNNNNNNNNNNLKMTYLNNIPGNMKSRNYKKTAIFGTAHLLRKVKMKKYKTFNWGKNITCSIYCT